MQEIVRDGSLEDLIQERKCNGTGFTEKEVVKIIKGILLGLNYIHKKGYVHGDIKTMNILMADKNDLSKIKIIDFGICQKLESKSEKLEKRWGTLMYIAPEVIRKEGYGPGVDIWSTAIIMYKLLKQGNHPFLQGVRTKKEIIKILKQKYLPDQEELLGEEA